jgi:hypothetical protein
MLICTMSMMADNPFITKLMSKIDTYSVNYASEYIYIHTDKLVYQTGDEIWFRAYVMNPLDKKLSTLSQTLYYKVFGPDGKELYSSKSIIQNGLCDGSIKVSQKWDEGRYLVIFFSSWMKNQPPNQISQKEVFIRKGEFIPVQIKSAVGYQVISQGNQLVYNGNLSLTNGKILASQKFNYIISTRKNRISKGQFSSDPSGNFSIQIKIKNSNPEGSYMLEVSGKSENENIYGLTNLPWLTTPVTLTIVPEGGNMFAADSSKVAFIAKDKNGFTFPFKADITDSKGNSCAHVNSAANKWAVTKLKLAANEKYHAKIISPSGIDNEFVLPEVRNSGISMQLINSSDDFVLMRIAPIQPDIPMAYLTARMGSTIFWAAKLNLREERNISIPIRNLPSGIVDISLIDTFGNAKAWRPLFINHELQPVLEAKTSLASYQPHQKVILELSLKDSKNQPLEGFLSASVAQLQQPITGNELPASFYVHSTVTGDQDLSAFYNSTGFNFSEINYPVYAEQFNWSGWPAIVSLNNSMKHYSSREGILGLVLNKLNKPSPYALVGISNSSDYEIQQTRCNERGEFLLPTLAQPVIQEELNLHATTEDKITKLNIHLDDSYEKSLSNYLDSLGYQMDIKNSDISSSVKITDTRNEYQKKAAHNRFMMDIIYQMKSYKVADNQIYFSGMRSSLIYQPGALIVIDGSAMGTDITTLANMNVDLVSDVKIYTNTSDILKFTGLNGFGGVIEVKMKTAGEFQTENLTSNPVYKLIAYKPVSTFVSPEYSIESAQLNTKPDNRTTLFWKPGVNINKEGKTTLEFYTSDVKGKYTAIFQGFTTNGIPVFGYTEFEVK